MNADDRGIANGDPTHATGTAPHPASHVPNPSPALESTSWDEDRLGTGVASIDEQHRLLFEIVERLRLLCQSGVDRKRLGRIIEFVRHYAVGHFRHEEEIMDRHRCPAREVNCAAHQQFLQQLESLVAKFDQGADPQHVGVELCTFLNDWLRDHIGCVDIQLRSDGGCHARNGLWLR